MESPTPEFVSDGMPVVDSSNVAPHSAISENSTSADILWLVRQRSQLSQTQKSYVGSLQEFQRQGLKH